MVEFNRPDGANIIQKIDEKFKFHILLKYIDHWNL